MTDNTITGNGGTGNNVFGGAYASGAISVTNSIVLGDIASASGA